MPASISVRALYSAGEAADISEVHAGADKRAVLSPALVSAVLARVWAGPCDGGDDDGDGDGDGDESEGGAR